MAERRLFIDIQAKSNPSTGGDQKPEVRAESWTRTDNTFKFNFVAEDRVASTSLLETTPPSVELSRLTVCKEEGSERFAFNFQIPAVTPEPMDPDAPAAPGSEPSPPGAQKPSPHTTLEACVPSESLAESKPKKKKKSGKKKTTESSKPQETTSSSAGSHGDKESVLTAEQQLQRELDWVMEQLRLGLETQKGTPKQKEDALRALKILRSGKAPLAKKRQVMRAATGDYRRKMEEERQKQLKLIQSAMTSLQVRTVPDPKKSVFHRRAGTKTGVPGAGERSARPPLASEPPPSGNETSHFVFTASKEEFKFNFV